jgi:hypothetical protein
LVSCGGSDGPTKVATASGGPAILDQIDPGEHRPQLVATPDGVITLLLLPLGLAGESGVQSVERDPGSEAWASPVTLPGSDSTSDGQVAAGADGEVVVAALRCPDRDVEGCRGGGAEVQVWFRTGPGAWSSGPTVPFPVESEGRNVSYSLGSHDGRALIELSGEVNELDAWTVDSDGASRVEVSVERDTCTTGRVTIGYRPLDSTAGIGDAAVGVEDARLPGTSYEVTSGSPGDGPERVLGVVELASPSSLSCSAQGATFLTTQGLVVADEEGMRTVTSETLAPDLAPTRVVGSDGGLYAGASGDGRLALVGVDQSGEPFAGSVQLQEDEQLLSALLTEGGTAQLIIDRQELLNDDEAGVEDRVSYRLVEAVLDPVG